MFILYITVEVISGIVSMLPFFLWSWLHYKKNHDNIIWQTQMGSLFVFLFMCFILALFAVTGIPSIYHLGFDANIELIPFSGLTSNIMQYLLNIVLFVPLGLFLPLLFEHCCHIKNILLYGFILSFGIEVLQLFSYRTTDIDDIIANTLGTLAGYLIFCFLGKLYPKIKVLCYIYTENDESIVPLISHKPYYYILITWLSVFLLQPLVANFISWPILLHFQHV